MSRGKFREPPPKLLLYYFFIAITRFSNCLDSIYSISNFNNYCVKDLKNKTLLVYFSVVYMVYYGQARKVKGKSMCPTAKSTRHNDSL